jgi:hypothetical protein
MLSRYEKGAGIEPAPFDPATFGRSDYLIADGTFSVPAMIFVR